MKTIGLIGGMSWESTAVYYRLLNEIVRARLGGLHSAELLLWSFDFHEVVVEIAADLFGKSIRIEIAHVAIVGPIHFVGCRGACHT